TAHRVECRALAAQHPVERPDRAVSADDAENAETAQRVDRYDTANLQSKQRIYVTHREPVAGIVRRKADPIEKGFDKDPHRLRSYPATTILLNELIVTARPNRRPRPRDIKMRSRS